jgi:hypothetical protein
MEISKCKHWNDKFYSLTLSLSHTHTHTLTIYDVSSWTGGTCLLWYVTITKLMLSNYNAVGRHNASGKQNVCLTSELRRNLLPSTHNRYFLLTHTQQRRMLIPSLPEHELGSPLWTLQHTDPCISEGLQYTICQNMLSCRSINWPSAALTTKQ